MNIIKSKGCSTSNLRRGEKSNEKKTAAVRERDYRSVTQSVATAGFKFMASWSHKVMAPRNLFYFIATFVPKYPHASSSAIAKYGVRSSWCTVTRFISFYTPLEWPLINSSTPSVRSFDTQPEIKTPQNLKLPVRFVYDWGWDQYFFQHAVIPVLKRESYYFSITNLCLSLKHIIVCFLKNRTAFLDSLTFSHICFYLVSEGFYCFFVFSYIFFSESYYCFVVTSSIFLRFVF